MNYCKMILLVFKKFSWLQNMHYKMQTHHKIIERDFMGDLIVHYFMREKGYE